MYQCKKPPSNTNKSHICTESVHREFLMLFDCLNLLNNDDNTIMIFKPVALDTLRKTECNKNECINTQAFHESFTVVSSHIQP